MIIVASSNGTVRPPAFLSGDSPPLAAAAIPNPAKVQQINLSRLVFMALLRR